MYSCQCEQWIQLPLERLSLGLPRLISICIYLSFLDPCRGAFNHEEAILHSLRMSAYFRLAHYLGVDHRIGKRRPCSLLLSMQVRRLGSVSGKPTPGGPAILSRRSLRVKELVIPLIQGSRSAPYSSARRLS
jgi:hypothetical protein